MTAVIILNYNDADASIEAVRRIHDYPSVDRILVVDNASTDDSAVRMQGAFRAERLSKVTLLRSEKNGGYGAGNNIGVRYAFKHFQADYAVIANPDAVFSEELLIAMKAVFAAEPQTGAVGAVMRPQTGAVGAVTGPTSVAGETADEDITANDITYEAYKRSGWKYRSFSEELLASGPVLKRIFDQKINYGRDYYAGGPQSGRALEVYAVHGSLLMVNVPAFMGIGGYDERMFLYMEEYVLGHKLRAVGMKTFLLRAYYEHEGSHSITGAGNGAVKRQRFRQASERIYFRHYLKAGPLKMLAARLVQQAVLLETGVYALLARD